VLPLGVALVVPVVGADVGADVGVDVGADVGVEVEPGLTPVLCIGVGAVPPQLTSVRAIKTIKQIFTRNSPALISSPGRLR
jgi:hypothetical protein